MDNENGIDNRNRNCNWIILGFNAIDTFNYKEFSIEYIKEGWVVLGIAQNNTSEQLTAIFESCGEAKEELFCALNKIRTS